MNNRFLLALVLTAIVIVVTPLIFPGSLQRSSARRGDSATAAVRAAVAPSLDTVRSTRTIARVDSIVVSPFKQAATVDTTIVRAGVSTYAFSSMGAQLVSVQLDNYPSHRKGSAPANVQIVGRNQALTTAHLVFGHDTIALDTIRFVSDKVESTVHAASYAASVGGHSIRVTYSFPTDTANTYLLHQSVTVADAPPGSKLLASLPRTLYANEADTVDDLNHLAVSYRSSRGEVNSIGFSKLDSTETRSEPGPIAWVAARNKYFVVVYRSTITPFSSLDLRGRPRKGKIAEEMLGTISLPLSVDGTVGFDIYAGPQSFARLQQLGNDLDQVNPYAGFLHGVVQPFTTVVMKALLWMKRTTQLNYGWVLVLFGIMIRLVLWPLNQGAMRTSMKMQRLQPELQALQKKHSDDPKKQQEAIMKVYKEHGMSPLSPLMGCLPMLLPMPVLFALYQVFQNTIEFRGVPFLWLTDISLRDPYYITPLLMGISMFVMSWIGMRNSPPNPQAKMMSYMMPVMLTVLFLNFASGLNLYYAVQNVAAIPQQWLLARERGKQGTPPVALAKRRA